MIRIVLSRKDFEALVNGEQIEKDPDCGCKGKHTKAQIILSDIGFDVMRDAVDKAEEE